MNYDNYNFVIDSLDNIIKDDNNYNKDKNNIFLKTYHPKQLKNVKKFLIKFIGKKINDKSHIL